MRWRWPWFEEKASQFASITVRTPGKAVWPVRNPEQLAREGYQKNVTAFRCIQLIASNCAQVPLALYDGEKEVEKHALLDLLANPNPYQDYAAFVESFI